MYGFTKVDWTDHEFAAFVQKHDLNSFSPGPAVKWTRQGAYPLVHATVIFDNAAMSRNIWINDRFLDCPKGCGYVCFYKGEKHEVYADTSLGAQEEALQHFQKKHPRRKIKSWEVSTTIAEKVDGSPYVHNTTEF